MKFLGGIGRWKKDNCKIFIKEQLRGFIIDRNWEHYTRASLGEKNWKLNIRFVEFDMFDIQVRVVYY